MAAAAGDPGRCGRGGDPRWRPISPRRCRLEVAGAASGPPVRRRHGAGAVAEGGGSCGGSAARPGAAAAFRGQPVTTGPLAATTVGPWAVAGERGPCGGRGRCEAAGSNRGMASGCTPRKGFGRQPWAAAVAVTQNESLGDAFRQRPATAGPSAAIAVPWPAATERKVCAAAAARLRAAAVARPLDP